MQVVIGKLDEKHRRPFHNIGKLSNYHSQTTKETVTVKKAEVRIKHSTIYSQIQVL